MELKKRGKFITDFYGSLPMLGAETVLAKWIEDKQNKWLLSWAEKIKTGGQTAMNALEKNLSVFHKDEEGKPILGNWMLRKCLIVTGQTIFNAKNNKEHPKKDIIPMAIKLVRPEMINLINGKTIKAPDGVKTYTVTTKVKGQPSSFFKAYEYILAGAEFEAEICFDDEFIKKKQINLLLDKAGSIGVGAFRERFGKFKWI